MFSSNYKQAPAFAFKQAQTHQTTTQPLNLNGGQSHIMISQSSMHQLQQNQQHFAYGNSVDSTASSVNASSLLSAANTLVLSPHASSPSSSFSPSSSLQGKRASLGGGNFTNTLYKLQQEPSGLNHESLDFDLHYGGDAVAEDSLTHTVANSKTNETAVNQLNKVNVTTNSISSGNFGHVLFKEDGDDLDLFDEELMSESNGMNDENEDENDDDLNELHDAQTRSKHITDSKASSSTRGPSNGLPKNSIAQNGFFVGKSKSMSMNMPIESNQSVTNNGISNVDCAAANASIDSAKGGPSSITNSLSTSALG
jgi:hypothetical protein